MNKFLITAIALFLVSINSFATNELKDVKVPVKAVHVPLGFDDNDDSQIIIAGYLPDPCFKAPKADFNKIGNKIEVTVTAMRKPDQVCVDMVVPFLEVISLGPLEAGHYDITANEGTDVKAQLYVGKANSYSVDEFVYANVTQVEIDYATRTAYLKGFNPSNCFELDQIKVISNKADTFSVLPIMKNVNPQCPIRKVPFSYSFKIPNDLTVPEVLLHVRIMNGKSVNAVFDQLL